MILLIIMYVVHARNIYSIIRQGVELVIEGWILVANKDLNTFKKTEL